MSNLEEVEGVESMAAIMAELRTDAKTLSSDLVRGIMAFHSLGWLLILVAIFSGVSTLFLWTPESYTGLVKYVQIGSLYVLTTYGLIQGYRVLKKHSAMRRKYSTLMDISSKLGD